MTWLSKAAVLWALEDAPDVPARLVSTLVVVARYADQNGFGAHPSAATIAAQTRKTERQVKRDLDELERLGLLVPGDRRVTAHLRADRRPNVYDLPMPRGDTRDTPSAFHGVTPVTARGDIQGRHGVSPMSPEEILNRSGKRERGRHRRQPPRRGDTPYLAPPCPECGKAFSQDELSDPDFRQLALRGVAVCGACQLLIGDQAQ